MRKRKIEDAELGEKKKEKEEEEDEEDTEGSEVSDRDESEDSDDSEDSDEDSCPDVSDEGEEEDDESAEEGEDYKEIDVEFAFCDPKEEDFLGLRTLLHTYLDGRIFDISGLVSAIIKQDAVGTVLKAAEESDPIAVLTVFNTVTNAKEEFIKQTKEFLVSKCKPELKDRIEKIFSEKGNGLLVSERLINSPPKIAPPLVQFLFDEIKYAAEDEETEEARESFRFKQYLLVTRVYSDPLGEPEPGASGSGSKRRKGKKQKAPAESLIVYVRPEDEYLHQVCEWSCTFPVENRQANKDELQPLRLVMAVRAERVAEARRVLDQVVGNMAADIEKN